MKTELNVGFIGNPNCGKTTLFNAYTGSKLKVANWPGVTVEKKEGVFKFHEEKFKLVDLPGIYSITSYTMEERLSRNYILEDEVDVIVDVLDASSLERNLYLTLQLIELGKPIVVALNMMDIVEQRGMELDLHRLPEMLGVPVIPVSARKKKGLDVLMHAVAHHKDNLYGDEKEHHHHKNEFKHKHNHHKEYTIVYSDEIEDKIDVISEMIFTSYPNTKNLRWHSIKVLERDKEILEKFNLSFDDIIGEKEYDKEIINQKYDFIEEIINEVLINKNKKEQLTDKVDKWLVHPIFGLPIFIIIMALVFLFTFKIGDIFAGYFEKLIEFGSNNLADFLNYLKVNEFIHSLIIDGIVAGVGGILTFLPNIFILFLALAFLEDSGYMSRVAYVMDGIMSKMGLSGRAFIPMLLGFGCSVPAVMASRTLENQKDRLKTILVTPFMSCSAKLPIYVLLSQAFFRDKAMYVAFSMYVISIFTAVLISLLISFFDKNKSKNYLLIELPEYKTPNLRSIYIYVYEKVKDYLSKAGTIIFLASIIVWIILNFGFNGMTSDMSESFAAVIGKALVPVFKPIGLGYWQVVVSLISGLAAKELVVSSMSVLYSVSNITSNQGLLEFSSLLNSDGFSGINAFLLMLFSLLYVPCIATVATIKNETKSWKWAIVSMSMQIGVAWISCFIVFQVYSLFI